MASTSRHIGLIVGALLLATCAVACGDDSSDRQATDPATGDTRLELGALNGRTFVASDQEALDSPDTALADGTGIELSFAGTDLSAYAGCNRLGGGVAIKGGRLEVGELRSTNMACAEEVMAQDAWLAEFLASSPAITLTGGHDLTLVSGEETLRLTEDG